MASKLFTFTCICHGPHTRAPNSSTKPIALHLPAALKSADHSWQGPVAAGTGMPLSWATRSSVLLRTHAAPCVSGELNTTGSMPLIPQVTRHHGVLAAPPAKPSATYPSVPCRRQIASRSRGPCVPPQRPQHEPVRSPDDARPCPAQEVHHREMHGRSHCPATGVRLRVLVGE